MALPRYEGIEPLSGARLASQVQFVYILRETPPEELEELYAYIEYLLMIIQQMQPQMLPYGYTPYIMSITRLGAASSVPY